MMLIGVFDPTFVGTWLAYFWKLLEAVVFG